MSTISIEAKLIVNDQQREVLFQSHKIFHSHLTFVILKMLRALHGKYGKNQQKLILAALSVNAKYGVAILESMTSPDWDADNVKIEKDNQKWKIVAKKEHASGNLLFNRFVEMSNCSSVMRRTVFSTAIQIIRGHRLLFRLWKKEHKAWRRAKAEWEKKNAEYMAVRQFFLDWEQKRGCIKANRKAWRDYILFLSNCREIICWRQPGTVVLPVTKEEILANNRLPRRRRKYESQLFFDKNPEIKRVDELHMQYRELYGREHRPKRYYDGFKCPPTLTLPSFDKHPAWIVFAKEDGYTTLDLHNGSIVLKCIMSENDYQSMRFELKPDPRLLSVVKNPDAKDRKFPMIWIDPVTGNQTACNLAGAKLIFRGYQPYIVFSLGMKGVFGHKFIIEKTVKTNNGTVGTLDSEEKNYEDPNELEEDGVDYDDDDDDEEETFDENWEDNEEEVDEATSANKAINSRNKKKKNVKKIYVKDIPHGTRILGVDKGQKNHQIILRMGVFDKDKNLVDFVPFFIPDPNDTNKESRMVSAYFLRVDGLTMRDLQKHERQIQQQSKLLCFTRKSKPTKSVAKERTFKKQRKHLLDMKADGRKKVSNFLVRTALLNNAQVIVVENLKHKFSLSKSNRNNRNWSIWSSCRDTDFLTQMANRYGIFVCKESAFYTSQVCYKCGSLGVRVSLPNREAWRLFYERELGDTPHYVIEKTGNLFCCSGCKTIVNADVNAASNMALVFCNLFRRPSVNPNWSQIEDACLPMIDELNNKLLSEQTKEPNQELIVEFA